MDAAEPRRLVDGTVELKRMAKMHSVSFGSRDAFGLLRSSTREDEGRTLI